MDGVHPASGSMPGELDPDPIPLSALQHAVFCLRQAALIHLERVWAENRFTAEGQIMHQRVDAGGSRRVRGVRRENGLHLASVRLGISGVADLVEFRATTRGEVPFPVEFKRGKPKLHRADEVQLCAQALCLEDMTGSPVPEGALFYGQTKRRAPVSFDADLRQLTETTISQLRAVFASRQTPPALYRADRCRVCSLADLCQPRLAGKSARDWRQRSARALLADGPS